MKKVRKSIKVFAVLGIFLMLLLALFLATDINPNSPDRFDYFPGSWSRGDIWGSTRHFFDFKAHRQERCQRIVREFALKLDPFIAANSNDVETMTGIAVVCPNWNFTGKLIANVRSKWPEYEPAMVWQGHYEFLEILNTTNYMLRPDNLWIRHDPNEPFVLTSYAAEESMVRRDDPFVRLKDKSDDPDTGPIVIADTEAAKRTIAARFAARFDEHMSVLRKLSDDDPNNALYDLMMAAACARVSRQEQANASLRAAANRRIVFRTDQIQKCMEKCVDKAGLTSGVKKMGIWEIQSTNESVTGFLERTLRQQAAKAERTGDNESAKLMRDAAQKIVDDAAATQPPAKPK